MSIKNITRLTGEIGELKVAMKLIDRGHIPARPYADNGIDILLENGKTLQVKTVILTGGKYRNYRFKLNDKKIIADFIVCFCMDTEDVFIIPSNKIEVKYTIAIGRKNSKYDIYKNKWDLLG